jgi:biopolymer transport protein ExbD
MGPSSTRRKRLITEINMVPFIDVVLVLLIIFMILSPFLSQSQIPVKLPRAESNRSLDDDTPLKVHVTRDGDYYIGGKRVLRAQVKDGLRRALAADRRRAVLIEADRDAPFKNVVVALDAAEQAEAARVGVAVQNSSQ